MIILLLQSDGHVYLAFSSVQYHVIHIHIYKQTYIFNLFITVIQYIKPQYIKTNELTQSNQSEFRIKQPCVVKTLIG